MGGFPELTRRRQHHPRLRWLRFQSDHGGPEPGPGETPSGIVPAKDPSVSADADGRGVAADQDGYATHTAIRPGNIFYTGKEICVEELMLPLFLPPGWDREIVAPSKDRPEVQGPVEAATKDSDPASLADPPTAKLARSRLKVAMAAVRVGAVLSSSAENTPQPVVHHHDRKVDLRPALLAHMPSWSEAAAGSVATVCTAQEAQAGPKKMANDLKDRKYALRFPPVSQLEARQGRTPYSARGTGKVAREYLDCSNWSVSDDYVSTLLHQAELRRLKYINIADNRITEKTIDLMTKLGKGQFSELTGLRLSRNQLSHNGGEAMTRFLEEVRPPIQELDLTGNLLGDRACELLCDALSAMTGKSLIGLGLAQNMLGRDGIAGAALGGMVRTCLELKVLDLHWNDLHGDDATAFLNGLYENNVKVGGKLRRLDLSWNRLGGKSCCTGMKANKTGNSGTTPDAAPEHTDMATMCQVNFENKFCDCDTCKAYTCIAEVFASVFKEGSTLFHLDLSFNYLRTSQCAIIAEGLRNNHSLFGLHLHGNEATVDELGFVIPCAPGCELELEQRRNVVNDLVSDIPSSIRLEKTPVDMSIASASFTTRVSKPFKQKTSHVSGRSVRSMKRSGMASIASIRLSGPPELRPELGLFGSHKMNPALRSVAPNRRICRQAAAFSMQDFETEKKWIAMQAKVYQPLGLSGPEDVIRRNAHCCWICENWMEQVVSFNPPKSSIAEEVCPKSNAYAFFNIDLFTRPTKLQRKLKNGFEIFYQGSRMLPPSSMPIQVVFQFGDKIFTSKDMAEQELTEAVTLRLVSDPSMQDEYQTQDVNFVNTFTPADTLIEMFALGRARPLIVMEEPRTRGKVQVTPRTISSQLL